MENMLCNECGGKENQKWKSDIFCDICYEDMLNGVSELAKYADEHEYETI